MKIPGCFLQDDHPPSDHDSSTSTSYNEETESTFRADHRCAGCGEIPTNVVAEVTKPFIMIFILI